MRKIDRPTKYKYGVFPNTNTKKGDNRKCVICGRGPFPSEKRVDVQSAFTSEYQVWCLKCYKEALRI